MMTRRPGVPAAVLMLALGACGTPPPTVQLTMDARRDGATLRIEGTTDLADGAVLAYEVRHEQLDVDPETPIEMLFTDGTITVEGGRYAANVDLSNFEPGVLEIVVVFRMDLKYGARQPRRLVRQFGDRGDKLEGANVTVSEQGKRVELTTTVHW